MKRYYLNDFLNAKKFPKYMFVSNFLFDFSQIISIKELACGGVGCVYKVEFNGAPSSVCIKLQSKSSSFKQFASVYSSNRGILNEYVVQIYEIGSVLIGNTSLNYTIMEYIPYQSLNKQQLNNKDITSLFMFLLQFMNTLHSNNMSYSDIKPENIVYTSDNQFKVIDIDTLMPLIPESREAVYNTTTDYYDITDTVLFSSHPLSQLASCVYTCLECMHIYPKCSKKNPIYQYENYLLNLAKYYNITNANQIPTVFDTIYEYLLDVTHSELYTLLSIFVMYILLIPKYTIAYIDSYYWYNIFSWYYQYIPETSESIVELCNNDNLKENMKTILAIGVESWTTTTDPEIEASKIPTFINTNVFQQTLPNYIATYREKINKFPDILKRKYKTYTTQQDNYSLLRQDPRTTLRTPLYKRI